MPAISDVPYLNPGSGPLLARIFRPDGKGPFPAMVDVHGGAWGMYDRTRDTSIGESLANSGILVMAIDFRMQPMAGYPASIQDVNFAVRWLKANAQDLSTEPELIGVMGSSSGGHQAMLSAMRPRDARYCTHPLSGNSSGPTAEVRCAVLNGPVLDPLERYKWAKRLIEQGDKAPPYLLKVAQLVFPLHQQYWGSEANMREGNPVLALEEGEDLVLPPVLYLQGEYDLVHPREVCERFVNGYRKAGGQVSLEVLKGAANEFIHQDPDSDSAKQALREIADFVHAQAGSRHR